MKLFNLSLVLVLTVALSAFAFAAGMEKGDFVVSGNSEGYRLNTGKGERIQMEIVTFATEFKSAPKVLATLTGFDATTEEKAGTVRVQISVDKVTKTGFVLKIKTWGESTVGAVWGSWLAFE
jgi:hypothetical protein